MRAAGAAETDAQDELDARRTALDRVRGALPSLEEEARIGSHHVVAAANAILAAAAIPLLAEDERLRVRFPDHLAVLKLLTAADLEDERRRRFARRFF